MTEEVCKDVRSDWFNWSDPDPAWCRQVAEVPGLQWTGDGKRVTRVKFHRSHLPLMPAAVSAALPPVGQWAMDETRYIEAKLKERGIVPRKHQSAAFPFLRGRRGALLAYEMRLGKTLAATAAHDPRDGVLVVVGPLAARDVWCEWIERVHGFRPMLLQGRKDIEDKVVDGYPAYFIHFDILEAWTPFFTTQQIATLVLDEIHLLQNRKARRTSAVNVLAARAERIFGLSGTPMWSKPDNLYAILHLIAPGAWGAHHAFGCRYANGLPGAHGWSYNGTSNDDEFKARLQHMILRKTWAEIAPDLPPTVRVVEPISVTGRQLASIESSAMNAALARKSAVTMAGYLATLRRKIGETKVGPAADAAWDAIVGGHQKVVIWAWHREVAAKIVAEATERIRAKGYIGAKVLELRSDMDGNERAAVIAEFKHHPQAAVLVAGIAVGGVAIDLSCSDYAIFAEVDWTPANNRQAEMRTFAPTRPHCVVYLYADVPVEVALFQALRVKEGFETAIGLGFDAVAEQVLGVLSSDSCPPSI